MTHLASRLWRILAITVSLIGMPAAAHAQSTAQTQNVTVRDEGSSILLDNGLVAVEISKANGNVLALTYRHLSLLAKPTYLNWNTTVDHVIRTGVYSLRTDPAKNGGQSAEVVITRKYPGSGDDAYDIALHHILRRGDSGYYSYAVFSHPKEYPEATLNVARMVLALRDDIFDFINIDDERRYVMAPSSTPVEELGPKESLRFLSGPFKGEITDKYHDYVDAGDHFVHGWISTQSKVGCWMVSGSNEDHNDGPTAQHNTAQWPRLLFHILTDPHYGGSGVDIAAGESWGKIYGPWMVYLNGAGSRDALWADAKKKAATERAAWPLAWVNEPLYPLTAGRGTVQGRLHLHDPQNPTVSPAGDWVGLAAPTPDWQQQAAGYQFWVHAGPDGSFTIPHVRPGNYTLYAFGNGVIDEFRHDGVSVAAGQTQDLGTLDWQAIHYGRILWQIGTPDRTAKEFRHGDNYRQWGLWLEYPKDFPNGVNFVIGKSNERTDWNYAQGTVLQNGQWVGTTWTITFAVKEPVKAGTAVLRLALASVTNAKLSISVNGTPVARLSKLGADSAMPRAGIHGQYQQQDVKFDSRLLKPGQNTISLDQINGGNPNRSVMYDCIRLEVPF